MRRTPFLGVVALASCTTTSDSFTVADPDGLAVSAVLELDGDVLPLARDRDGFLATRPIRRDAHGRIRVIYADGRQTDCPIGYVTPGAAQRWNFRLTPARCERL